MVPYITWLKGLFVSESLMLSASEKQNSWTLWKMQKMSTAKVFLYENKYFPLLRWFTLSNSLSKIVTFKLSSDQFLSIHYKYENVKFLQRHQN